MKKFELNTPIDWIALSFKTGIKHYVLFLLCGLLIFGLGTLVALIPILNVVLISLFAFVARYTTLRFSDRLMTSGSNLSFKDFFDELTDWEQLREVQILFVLSFFSNLLLIPIESSFPSSYQFIIHWVFSPMVNALWIFTAFYKHRSGKSDWTECLKTVFELLMENILIFLLFFLLVGLLNHISSFLYYIPVFFIFGPLLFVADYLVYKTLIDGVLPQEMAQDTVTVIDDKFSN